PLNPPTTYRAITGVYAVLAGTNHGLMPGSTAIAATVNTGNGTPQWNFGFRTAPGAAAIGILLSKLRVAGSGPSQPLNFTANNGSDLTASIHEDETGNLVANPA